MQLLGIRRQRHDGGKEEQEGKWKLYLCAKKGQKLPPRHEDLSPSVPAGENFFFYSAP
jgi:hypothetical protein